MARKIVAIEANTSPTRYVTATNPRYDNKITVEYTDNKNLAMDFCSKTAAAKIIEKIFNPFDRVFKVIELEVTQPQRLGEIAGDFFLDNLRLS